LPRAVWLFSDDEDHEEALLIGKLKNRDYGCLIGLDHLGFGDPRMAFVIVKLLKGEGDIHQGSRVWLPDRYPLKIFLIVRSKIVVEAANGAGGAVIAEGVEDEKRQC